MTFPADYCGLVLYRELLPLGLVGYAVPAIHVTTLMYAEVDRH
jgi:hypothetical protein